MKVLGLDVGEKRIGVARADSSTRIAVPIGFLNVDGTEWRELGRLSQLHGTTLFVIGLPRSNEGNETAQSVYVRNFAKALVTRIPGAKVRFQDESLTSVLAEERLKKRRKVYEKGEIDAEAASIILQDFLENLGSRNMNNASTPRATIPQQDSNEASAGVSAAKSGGISGKTPEELQTVKAVAKKEADKVKLNAKKAKSKTKTILGFIFLPLLILLIIGGIGTFVWGRAMLAPVDGDCRVSECEPVDFTVSEGESKSTIADNLAQNNLIHNSFVFKVYMQIFKSDVDFKSGSYKLSKGMSADEIIERLAKGVEDSNTFSFTVLPGETVFDIKNKLLKLNYTAEEIDAAFNAEYDFDFLKERPEGATLEGYLYGETHEFYGGTSVSEILTKYLEGMGEIIQENDLKTKFEAHGLSLFEGITLASIVQKEAHPQDQPTVAQIFLSRLSLGIPLGSDVTVSYALDVVDPERQLYSDNQSALTVESCYNTRLNAGLPCGPISNPGLSALLAVANPSDTSYLYFLTGDDGLMYYSSTESEHNQNIAEHCQELCNVSL